MPQQIKPAAAKHPVNYKLTVSAQTWLGTPYAEGERQKGVGVDCLNLLAGMAEEIGVLPVGAVDYGPAPYQFWINDPTYIEDRLAAAEQQFLMGAHWDIVTLPSTRKLLWLNDTVLPGDVVLFGTKDLPDVASHAVLADAVTHQLMRYIHAWNPVGGGGNVRHNVLGRYFVPFKRYRIVT